LPLWRSVKYEDIYLKNYATLPELLLGLVQYFVQYNSERHHYLLGYKTPDYVYSTDKEGDATIPDYFSKKTGSFK